MAASAGEQLSVDSALVTTLQDFQLSFSLSNEQRTALKSFLEKKDVFGFLPTRYVKSLILERGKFPSHCLRHLLRCSDWL
jgi:hypothetical protein